VNEERLKLILKCQLLSLTSGLEFCSNLHLA